MNNMQDVSEFIKSGFMNLHKKAIEKNYQQKTLHDRMTSFNNKRRETRNTLIYQKRQIDENMTPIASPVNHKVNKQIVDVAEVKMMNSRLEKLHKWKEEKEKRKQEEKRKAKPLFKVCHVPLNIGLPDLKDVNKHIKGKSIKANLSSPQSQFAPQNHKFRAPKNIKPIHINAVTAGKSSTTSPKNKTLDKTRRVAKAASNENLTRRNTRMMSKNLLPTKLDNTETGKKPYKPKSPHIPKMTTKTQTNSVKPNLTQNAKVEKKVYNSAGDKIASNPLPVEKNKSRHNVPKNESNNSSSVPKNKTASKKANNEMPTAVVKNLDNKSLRSRKSNRGVTKSVENIPEITLHDRELPNKTSPLVNDLKSTKKKVGWEQEDDVFAEDVVYRTPKPKYKKTPRKIQKVTSSDTESVSSSTKSRNSTVGYATGSASPDYPIDSLLEEDNFRTPQKNNIKGDAPIYISPFVTVSRGKDSARKEYKVRRSSGNITPDLGIDITSNVSPKAGAEYFAKKLNNEIKRIEDLCQIWSGYRNSTEVPEEAKDMIDVAIGQSKLLVSKKFEQFRGLINQCRQYEYLEKPITCEDLHGFWDMIYMQVEDLNKRFNNLTSLKENNWQEIIPEKKVVVKRGRGRPKKASASASLKNLIQAARNLKKSNPEKEIEIIAPQTDEVKTFAGGFYSIKSPHNDIKQLARTSTSRRSLRVSLLANQAKIRKSSSPYTLMKISQAIKSGDGITPSKSILKTDLTRSEKRTTKQVLFKDDLENSVVGTNENLDNHKRDEASKENDLNEINFICFSPATPRRSRRLSKMS